MNTIARVKSKTQNEEMFATDICQVLIHCQRHKTICLTTIPQKGLWLPFIHIDANDSWTLKLEQLMSTIGFEIENINLEFKLINESRLQQTQGSYVSRVTFLVQISEEVKSFKCCPLNDNYKWVSTSDLSKSNADLFCGLETIYWTKFYVLKEDIPLDEIWMTDPINEYDIRDALKDFSTDRVRSCKTSQQYLIRSACFGEKDILLIYEWFLDECYPSQTMTFSSFKRLLKKINVKLNENKPLPTFQAFDLKQRSYLTFNELILGLAALDPATEHGGESGSLRVAYIFRYYDENSDGFLNQSDICRMISDIKNLNTPYYPDQNGVSDSELAKTIVDSCGIDDKLSLEHFKTVVNSLKLRGTSYLFRAANATIRRSFKMSKDFSYLLPLQRNIKYDINCENCGQRKYLISRKAFLMESTGEVFDSFDLKQIHPKLTNSLLWSDKQTEDDLVIKMITNLNHLRRARFGSQTKQENPKKLNINNWFYESKEALIDNLLKVCKKAEQMFEKENRVLQISTPCYILGDIHGNFKDLSTFADCLWRSSPFLNKANYLFLGDYVDRGNYGVECVAFLFCLKLLAPKTFWLLRGNHEVRELQESFTFLTECQKRFDKNVWTAINDCFDRLPIAAIVDNKLFCSHGGIPTSSLNIDWLRECPTVLTDPREFPPVWECLWNDPISDHEFSQLSSFQKKDPNIQRGFLPNTKRGTAYYYSETSVDRFLDVNDIQMIVRGHECHFKGYKLLMNGKVLSIFSTSLYCNLRNVAAVLLVNHNRIRIISVHTFN